MELFERNDAQTCVFVEVGGHCHGHGQLCFFLVLFNGHKLKKFKSSRRIRQGDPISPYLFLLAAENLSCLLKSRNQSSSLRGIRVATSAPLVNHLLFADDSLLFFKANRDGAEEVSNQLEAYG